MQTKAQMMLAAAGAAFFCIGILVRFLTHHENLQRKDIRAAVKNKKTVLISLALFFFGFTFSCFFSYIDGKAVLPAFSVKFGFEEAGRGLNPDETRFNADDLINKDVLAGVIKDKGYSITPDELKECLSVRSSYDDTAIDTENPKIATEYQIALNRNIKKYSIDTDSLIDDLAAEVKQDYVQKHTDHAGILDIDLTEVDDLDYMDVDNYLQMQANKVKNYLSGFQWAEQTYSDESGETFSSLADKVSNYISTPLSEYSAYISENGLTKEGSDFVSTAEYTKKTLQVNYDKQMASYNARLSAIQKYDPSMANVVLVPTDDKTGEFYMSRTKIGVDYFADEANEALNNASEILKDINDNKRLVANISASASKEKYTEANAMILTLCRELTELAKEAEELHESYIRDTAGEYVTLHIYHPGKAALLSVRRNGVFSLWLGISSLYLCAELIRSGIIQKIRKGGRHAFRT